MPLRVPLLSGSRAVLVTVADDMELLLPPAPVAGLADVEAAVRDALRFPLSGGPLEALVPRGGRVTLVLDAGALPIRAGARDPRARALAAAVGELERIGVPTERQTILAAHGLARRASPRELEARLAPQLARRFDGRVEAHDAESSDLVHLGPARVGRALAEADAVVTVTAAETVAHGGPAALLAAADAGTIRAGGPEPSLLEAGGPAWQAALALERALSRRLPLVGVSLALSHPRFGGPLRGVPYEPAALARVVRSPARRSFGALPGPARRRLLHGLRAETGVQTVFAGPPSAAHAEALLRGLELRGRRLEAPLDALVLGVPPLTPNPPLERPNPLDVAYLGLGHALRLWRGGPPVAEGGTLVLLHRFHRRFAHPTQAPYRAFFAALREGAPGEPGSLREAEERAAADPAAIEAYRAGRACHPRLPFAQWEACGPARGLLGAVLVAGCRDAAAARGLGLVPVRGPATALDMARAAGAARIGLLPAPPFFPLLVGS